MVNTKKKLLITGSTFPRWEGDTEPRFILDYAKVMNNYFDVIVLVPMAPGAKEEEIMDGVQVIRYHYLPVHKWETLCYPGAIVARIKKKKIRIFLVPFLFVSMRHNLKKWSKQSDFVHANWLIPQGIVQSGIKGTPYMVTGHGGDVTGLNVWPITKLKTKTLKKAKYITVVSRMTEEFIQQFYPNNKTAIIPMGCDTTSFSPDKKRINFFGQGKKKVILFVGRLAKIKGIEYLIEAMKNVNDGILYIIGKGEMEEELKSLASEMKDKVVFLGAKTHAELPEIYASADVFVAPSVSMENGAKEGFGLVIIEAMASGIPVVASRSGGIVDIINDRENGILCEEKNINELSNAINEVLKDSDLREKLISNGIVTAEYNSYENVGKRYYKVISESLN